MLKKNINIAKNSIYLYLSHFADYILILAFLPLIANALGPSEFGKIGLAQTYGLMIAVIVEFGTSLIATRKVARIKNDKSELKQFASKVTSSKLFLIPVIILIFMILINSNPILIENPNYLFYSVVGAFFQGSSPIWYFTGLERMKAVSVYKFISRLIGFFLIYCFVNSPNDAWIVLVSFSLSSIIFCLFSYYVLIRDLGYLKLEFNLKSICLLSDSKYSFYITLVPLALQSIMMFCLSLIVNPFQLGIFYGANRIYRAFNTLFGPLSVAFFPFISTKYNNQKELFSLLKKYFILLFSFSLFLVLLNFILAEKLTFYLLGNSFQQSSDLLKVFSFVLPLTAITNALGRQWLLALNHDKKYFTTLFLALIVALTVFVVTINEIQVFAIPIALITFELFSIIILIFHLRNVYFKKI